MGSFKSKRQWRWCFGSGQSFCREWAHNTGSAPVKRYRELPARVKRRKTPQARTARP